ncbi:hypothetical protein MMC25_000128 [Agyrium rufum]|nr:hypothetical protein [Agyrium rufum]
MALESEFAIQSVWIHLFHGMLTSNRWLFWGQIPKGAIITTFSVKSLRKYLAKRSRLGELLRLNGIQESTSYSEYNRVITRDPPPLSAMIGRDIGHFLGFTNLDEGLLNIVASKIAKSWHFQGTVSVQRMEPYLTAVHDGYLTFFQQFRNGDFHDIITHFPPNPNHSSQLAHQPSFSSYPSSVSKDLASASAKPKPSIADDGLMMEFLEMGLAMEPISEYLSPVEMMVGIDERKRTECVSTKMPERMLDRIRVEARDLVGFADSDIDGDNNDTSLATGGAAIQQDIEFPDKRDNNRTKDILQRIETPSLVTWSAPTTPRSQGSSSEGNNEIPTPSTSTTTDEPVRSRYFGLKQHAKPPKERMFSALSILGSAMLRKNAPRLPMERQNIEDDDVIFLHETSRAIGGRLHDPQEAPKITRGNFSKSPVRNTKRTHPLNADMLNSDDELQYDDARANGFSTNRRRIQTLLNLDGIKKIA